VHALGSALGGRRRKSSLVALVQERDLRIGGPSVRAERWLRMHPSKVFLNDTCTVPFPFSLPAPAEMRIHRIACSERTNGPAS
jgi:hypothetical protein